ncbi:MAG: HlyC/CorC family transporter [Oscillospiraceae bacterium]|nr:HlyC/CorC family transporter [Oscillospiraceae bacterium]
MLDTVIWQLLLQLILIALNAVFACAEIAVISINDIKLQQLEAQGDKRAGRLLKLTEQPAKFLATIQVAITLSGFLGSAFAADNFSDQLVKLLLRLNVPIAEATLDSISVILITLILSFLTLVLGELVPKRIAMQKAEKLGLAMANMISFFAKLFAPIVWLLTASTNGVLRLFGIDPNAEEEENSEEEIRMMVDAGSKLGTIDVEEREMIQNVFEFDDISVDEFATHRTDIEVLWTEDDDYIWEDTIYSTGFSLYPICDSTVDNVIGVLNVKDYFRHKEGGRESVMANAVKAPYFVPETLTADVLFKQMKQKRNRFAVLLDEYGGVSGIVTMNDLLEQIVGDLSDGPEAEDEAPEFEQLEENKWAVRGSLPLDELCENLGITLEEGDFDTFGGLVFDAYGFFPEDGSRFEIDIAPMHIKVVDIREHRIERAIITIEKKDEE